METKRSKFFTHRAISDRGKKNLIVLDLIRKNGPISKTEISKLTNINIMSISNYINEYIGRKVVVDKGYDVSSGGRKPELVELNNEGMYIVGLDIRKAELRAVITDLSMRVIGRSAAPKEKESKKDAASKAISLVEELVKASRIEREKIEAMGISAPEADFISGAGILEKHFDAEVFLESEEICAAFGEKRLNPQADVHDILYMHSDVGSGVMIKGDMFFNAGFRPEEILDSDRRISWQELIYFSEKSQYLRPWSAQLGIIQSSRREVERGIGTKMVALSGGRIGNVTEDIVVEAARQNDDVALYILQNAAMNLGTRIAYLVNLFNPETVIIGGGIEKAGDIILEPIRKIVARLALKDRQDKVRIVSGCLGGDAATLGAAALTVREIFIKA